MPVQFGSGTDAAGTPIPTMVTTGSGTGTVATGAAVYDVRWSKATSAAPWKLSFTPTSAGGGATQSFALPAGRTWLALLPEDGGRVETTAPEAAAS